MKQQASQTSGQKVKEKKPMRTPVKVYLIAYNAVQFIGWTTILYLMLVELYTKRSYTGLWTATHIWLKVFQTAAILEVVHSIVGIVPSNPMLVLFQVYSRVFVVWGIINLVQMTQTTVGIPLLMFTWTITEMIRYSFYFFYLVSSAPYFLTWCRYTFFLFCYPSGVLGELICMFAALPILKASKVWSIELPNKANFSFNYHYYVILVMLGYIPVFPKLFFYMLNQRGKVLAPKKID